MTVVVLNVPGTTHGHYANQTANDRNKFNDAKSDVPHLI